LHYDLDAFLKWQWIMAVKAFLSELKKFFIDSFSSPVYQDGVLYFIIEELPNPRDSGISPLQIDAP